MSSRALMAETHPNEYLIHKYWARKPSNILHGYIRSHFKPGDLVVDPFCGSGVFLAEAKKLGINSRGFDINPLAQLLSEVTVNPPTVEEFNHEIENLISFADSFKELYTLDGKDVRYLVHRMESECPSCNTIGSIDNAIKKGSKYHCAKCDERLYFNFEKFTGTRIVKIITRDNEVYIDKKAIEKQESIIQKIPRIDSENLLINRRILAFPGMQLSDLFTPRAFYVLSQLFDKAHKIKKDSIRNAALLLLTSSVAQSSRLIPYRNNLSTGGPAWTIPGFWIAPLHLETNPVIHLQARYKKFVKGLEALASSYKNTGATSKIDLKPAQNGLEEFEDESIDGIFFDPPYGDNVPYVEFSAIWNGFLKKRVSYDDEIIVSDRKEYVSSWDKYGADIAIIVDLFQRKLKKGGKIIMTFNNLDPRAWKIVLESFSEKSFVCTEAKYQIPAVVSSKSQTASNTSYVGDYYCVFEKKVHPPKKKQDLFHLTEIAKKVLLSRGGTAPKNLVHRMIILCILNEGMNTLTLGKINEVIIPIATSDKDYYQLRDEFLGEIENAKKIEEYVANVAVDLLRDGKKSIKELYEAILESTFDIGSPSLGEVKNLLKHTVLFDKNYAYLQRITRTSTLF